jgi:hypothetical protein
MSIEEAAFKQARTTLGSVKVRHEEAGAVYDAVRSSLESTQTVGSMGAIQNADGAIRLLVSELKMPKPKAGDIIELVEQDDGDSSVRVVLAVRYDQARVTVRIDYGAQYGG